MDPASEVIEPAFNKFTNKIVRIDKIEHSGTISDTMDEEIRDCACFLADLTYAHQSVYFEIGLAKGLGIDIVLTRREDP